MARMTPAIGVLKVADMPAAAPQASRTFLSEAVVVEDLANQRSQRTTGLDDRSLSAERAAGADGNRGRQRLQDRHARLDAAAIEQHRFHRFRNSMTFDLRRAILGHEADDEPADHGNEDDP